MRLILVLGDQLSPTLSALREADKSRDVVVMAEVADEAGYVRHHPKKIALIFTAMRKFAERLRKDGWQVAYTRLDDAGNAGSITGELIRRAAEFGADEVIATTCGSWRLINALEDLPLPVHQFGDDRFIVSPTEFADWAEGRKSLRMEYFYREVRRKTGLLMDGDKPEGGKWNYDSENRKPAPDEVTFGGPKRFAPDADVVALVKDRFGHHFGEIEPFWFATDHAQAEEQLDHWLKGGLPQFGDFQDAMVQGQPFMYHAFIGLYLNIGLLDPLEVCKQAEAAYRDGHAPLNAVEGFIRQIIGWREYIRGIYFLEGPDYANRNTLGQTRDLPAVYWGGDTRMNCVAQAVGQTREHAYAHHIQRLMVTGNFALLAGVDPQQVHEWYLSVYADAFDWVEVPNTIGMSQFADGGIVASKPYVSSGAYIDRMSDYCKGCSYKVKDKTGENACPFNLLYWHFLIRHRDRFQSNPRMGQMYRTWDRMADDRRDTVLAEADAWLARLDAGEAV